VNSSEYNKYLNTIKLANDASDKTILKRIKNELISKYGEEDNDVKRLLSYIRFHV